MGHAHHFLSRLDRVQRDTMDFALSLYRDEELVKWVLGTSMIPESEPRVAIALHDSESSPHIVVTQDGHFVTCLGAGMSTKRLPIITRKELDAALRDITCWRSREGHAKKVVRPGGDVSDLFHLISVRGADLSREEFEALECWMPVIGFDSYRGLSVAVERLREAMVLAVAAPAKVRPPESLLRETWTPMWAIGHLTALSVTCDIRLFELMVEEQKYEPQTFTLGACQQGIIGVIARAAWVAGRLAHVLLWKYEHELIAARSDISVLDAVIGLDVIRTLDPNHYAEITELLAVVHEDDPKDSEASVMAGMVLSLSNCEAMQIVLDYGRHLCMEMTAKLPRDHALAFARSEDVPEDLAIAAAATCPLHYRASEPDSLRLTFALARVVAQRPAAQMYLPESFRAACGSFYSSTQFMDLVLTERRLAGKRVPHVVGPRVGRNDPCPCGRHKKYKHCCGLTGATHEGRPKQGVGAELCSLPSTLHAKPSASVWLM
jgi:SEC-C motif